MWMSKASLEIVESKIGAEVERAQAAHVGAQNAHDAAVALGTERGLKLALGIVRNEQRFLAMFSAFGFDWSVPVVAVDEDDARRQIRARARDVGFIRLRRMGDGHAA